MHPERIRQLHSGRIGEGPVIYWMSRDQRVKDNWAMIFAQQKALELQVPLVVVFCLVPNFLEATARQYGFMLSGLKEQEKLLQELNCGFVLLQGEPGEELPVFLHQIQAKCLVTDFDPLRIKQNWKLELQKKVDLPIFEVDSHNIVPCWLASQKQEYAARTIRPKIQSRLDDFLDEFSQVQRHPHTPAGQTDINWEKIKGQLRLDRSVQEVGWLTAGEKAGRHVLEHFIEHKLPLYADKRNDPNQDVLSNLSPYLHFGQISAQRVALEVLKKSKQQSGQEAFLEELIIRKELADNFCFYNPGYDSFKGLSNWARETLETHRQDERDYVYTLAEFENAKTHDPLWNAAQTEMVLTGKMHGYMRMYWAKKILEWSQDPEEALRIAIYLNDRYELDGRDPNGYVGVLWSIGGVHDRGWAERPVYGKVRYMNYNGCKRKFDVKGYMQKWLGQANEVS